MAFTPQGPDVVEGAHMSTYFGFVPTIGCEALWSLDGNWKLTYHVCMYQAPKCVKSCEGKLYIPNSCLGTGSSANLA